jgi:hypothetical protein
MFRQHIDHPWRTRISGGISGGTDSAIEVRVRPCPAFKLGSLNRLCQPGREFTPASHRKSRLRRETLQKQGFNECAALFNTTQSHGTLSIPERRLLGAISPCSTSQPLERFRFRTRGRECRRHTMIPFSLRIVSLAFIRVRGRVRLVPNNSTVRLIVMSQDTQITAQIEIAVGSVMSRAELEPRAGRGLP